MQNKRIIIVVADKSVEVNGERYVLETFDWPADIHHLSWEPEREKLKGFISKQGDAYRFETFDQFERYVAAWQDAKAEAQAEQARAAQKAEAEEKARKAEQEKAEAEAKAKFDAEQKAAMEKLAPYNALASTDFKIIKAMEAKLAAEGALDPDLVAQREAARQTISDSKA